MTRAIAFLALFLPVSAAAFGATLKLEERKHDIVRIKGIGDPIEGTIEKLDENILRFRKLNGEGRTWPRGEVIEIKRKCTLQQSYQLAAKAAGADPAAHFRLHEACLGAGLKKEAFVELKKAIRVDRKYMPAYEKLLKTARSAGNRDLELWALKGATDAGIATVPMLIRIAELYALLGLTDNAEEPLRNALRADPRNTKVQSRLAMLELMHGEPGRAKKHITAMLEHSPNDPCALVALGQPELAQGRLDKAADALAKAAADAELPEAAAGLGAIHLQRGDLAKAEEYYSQARAIRPGYAPAVAGQALVYARKGWLQRAKTLLREVAASSPKRPAVAAARAYVAELSGEHKAALEMYEAAAALDATNVHALAGAGRCHWRLGDRAKAAERFQQALALRPAFAPALRGLGRIALARNASDAAKYHMQLVTSGAATPEDRVALAGALMRLQRFGEASAELGRAGSDNVHARIGLGFLNYAQGKTDAAILHFKAAVELGDFRRYAASAIRRIQLAESRVSWADSFERPDGPEVLNGWDEHEPPGVSISISKKSVLIDGEPDEKDRTARLSRSEDGSSFVAITAEAETGSEATSFVGVYVALPGQKPAILFGRDGSSGYAVVSIAGKPRKLGNTIRQGKFTVGIGVIDRRKGTFALLVNGRRARGRRSYTVPSLAGAEELEVGLFARPPDGRRVNSRFHTVKIVRTK